MEWAQIIVCFVGLVYGFCLGWIASQETLIKRAVKPKEDGSPYCPLCESCGHEGCCSFLQCFSKLVENGKCDNGEQYLKDARFHFRISQLSEEVMSKLKDGQYNAEQAIENYHKEWNEIYDNVYKVEKNDH